MSEDYTIAVDSVMQRLGVTEYSQKCTVVNKVAKIRVTFSRLDKLEVINRKLLDLDSHSTWSVEGMEALIQIPVYVLERLNRSSVIPKLSREMYKDAIIVLLVAFVIIYIFSPNVHLSSLLFKNATVTPLVPPTTSG